MKNGKGRGVETRIFCKLSTKTDIRIDEMPNNRPKSESSLGSVKTIVLDFNKSQATYLLNGYVHSHIFIVGHTSI